MSVYGDMLSFFPEQFRRVEYFSMRTDVKAGFSGRMDLGTVRGVFQYMRKGELLRDGDVLSDTNVPAFWTRTKLEVGNFLKRPGDEDVYRIASDSNWSFEGGFYAYMLETVIGNTDEQVPFTRGEVDVGSGYL